MMRVIVVSAGAVATKAIESLHEHHECTVVDLDPGRSEILEVLVRAGNGQGSVLR